MDPIAHLTPKTSLRGLKVFARGISKPVFAFLGVPFAEPPVGNLRFAPTVSVKLWTGERNAKKFGNFIFKYSFIIYLTQTKSHCVAFILLLGSMSLLVKCASLVVNTNERMEADVRTLAQASCACFQFTCMTSTRIWFLTPPILVHMRLTPLPLWMSTCHQCFPVQ